MASDAFPRPELSVRWLDEVAARDLLSAVGHASWRQYPAYSAIAAQVAGAQSEYLLVERGADPVALANLRIKRIPMFPAGLAFITQGPVMFQSGGGAYSDTMAAIRHHVVCELGLTLRVNPPVDPDASVTRPEGFVPLAGSSYETFLIDLAPSIDVLRQQLNGKWRTDLNRGERSDVIITRSSLEPDFAAFQPLLEDLALGKGFNVPQDAHFFAKVAGRAVEPESIVIHLARHKGRVIGGHVGAYSGNMAVYLIGAANDEGRERRASFLLQWAAIEFAKQRAMAWYDLGGADEHANPNVFRFKQRMGGRHYVGPPVIEARAGWPRGAIVNLAEKAYARVRG